MYHLASSLTLAVDLITQASLSGRPEDLVIWGVVALILLLTTLGVLGYQRSRKKVMQEEMVMDFWSDNLRRLLERYEKRRKPSAHEILFSVYTEWMRSEERAGTNAAKVESNEELVESLRGLEAKLQERDEELSLLEERLLLISSRTNRNNTMSFMPHISELHELSLQRMESDRWSKMLYMTTATVLICGICGTLWSVHLELRDMTAAQLTMAALAPSLRPSGIAVIANILLIILRNRLARELDSRLGELDDLTLTLFTPALQPKSRIGQEHDIFKFRTSIFSNDAAQSPFKSFFEAFSEMPLRMQQAMSLLQHIPGKILSLLNTQKKLYLFALRKLQELLAVQAQQVQQLSESAAKLIITAQALTRLKQEQDNMIATLHALHQDTAAAGIAPGDLYARHRDACNALQETMASISASVASLARWKKASTDTERLCNQLVQHIETQTRHISSCAMSAYELSQLATPLPEQLSHLSQEWKSCMLSNASTAESFAPIIQAADAFDLKLQSMTANQRKGMIAAAKMAEDHRTELSGTLTSLQKAMTDFIVDTNNSSPWPRVYAALIILAIIFTLSVLLFFCLPFLLSL